MWSTHAQVNGTMDDKQLHLGSDVAAGTVARTLSSSSMTSARSSLLFSNREATPSS